MIKERETMEESTTTNAPVETGENQIIGGIQVDNQGQAISQPEEAEPAEAVTTTNEPEEETAVTSEPSDDEQLTKFAETKGLVLDSDNAKKAAKMAMNAEKLMHTKSNRASELERTMSAMADESAAQVAQATGKDPEFQAFKLKTEVKEAIRDFWDSNPDAKQYETEMAKIATESGLYGTPEAILKASYAMAVANGVNDIKSQGKREALESLAHKQQASVPRGNAVNSSMTSQNITPQNVEQLVAQNSQAWFEKNYAAINQAMRG